MKATTTTNGGDMYNADGNSRFDEIARDYALRGHLALGALDAPTLDEIASCARAKLACPAWEHDAMLANLSADAEAAAGRLYCALYGAEDTAAEDTVTIPREDAQRAITALGREGLRHADRARQLQRDIDRKSCALRYAPTLRGAHLQRALAATDAARRIAEQLGDREWASELTRRIAELRGW